MCFLAKWRPVQSVAANASSGGSRLFPMLRWSTQLQWKNEVSDNSSSFRIKSPFTMSNNPSKSWIPLHEPIPRRVSMNSYLTCACPGDAIVKRFTWGTGESESEQGSSRVLMGVCSYFWRSADTLRSYVWQLVLSRLTARHHCCNGNWFLI